jgi:uncharacterized protein YciW
MARRKRTSKVVAKARMRAVLLTSISETLELTEELTLADYRAHITAVEQRLAAYNMKLAELDGMLNDLEAAEKGLNEHTKRMLAAVGVVYGRDSNEYEQAGGTRQSEINYRPSPPKRDAPSE